MIVNLTPRRKERKCISIKVEMNLSIISLLLLLLFPILGVNSNMLLKPKGNGKVIT